MIQERLAAPLTPAAPSTSTSTPAPIARPTPLARELGLALALWRRDLLKLRRDTGRWVGIVLQPLLLWGLLGSGMSGVFAMKASPGTSSLAFLFPGFVAMIALFTSIFATMAVIEDRQHGFLQQVMVAPGSRFAMIIGKILGVLSIALIQLALALPATLLAGFSLGGIDWPLLLASFTLGTIALTAFSFALAWMVKTTQAYHALMGVLLLPLWLVSGALFPLPATGFLHALAHINPIAYMVDGLRYAFAGSTAQGALASPGVALAALGGIAVFALAVAAWLARRVEGARA